MTRNRLGISATIGRTALACAVAAILVASGSFAAPPMQIAEKKPPEDAAMLVKVDVVGEQPLVQTMPVLGRLVPRRAGVVAARAAGPVGQMKVEVGDRVAAGDVLAVLVKDAIEARQDLAWAELETARQELARMAKLKRSRSAAFAGSRYDIAVQEVAMAKANLRLAEINIYNADIRAPYPGVVSVRHTEIGSWLAVGQSVVTLVDDKDMEVEADVPSNRISGLVPGTKVLLELADGSRHDAIVRAVIPAENPRTRTRAVRFVPSFGAAAGALASNQSVTVHVPLGRARRIVSVHKDAIINRGGRNLVYLVDGEKAVVRPVRLGAAVGSRFEVVSGLKPGDLVVVRGNERLRSGQKVRYERGS